MNILLVAAVGIIALLCSCKSHQTTQPDSLSIAVDPSVPFQFERLLNAIGLLIGDENNSVVDVSFGGTANLTFRSFGDFHGDPNFIYVLSDRIAWGSGSSRRLMSVEDLQKNLQMLAEAAASSGTEGFILMASDRNVSGQFGLNVLNAISLAGLPNVMLRTQEFTNQSTPKQTKKPSSPGQQNKKQNRVSGSS